MSANEVTGILYYLVAPQKFITGSILNCVPGVEELGDTMMPNMVRILFRFFPGKRSTKVEQSHPAERY